MDTRTTLARADRRADQGRDAHRRGDRLGDERDHGRRGHARPDRRLRRGAADEGRDRRPRSAAWPRPCWTTRRRSRCPAGWSTWSAPAATARTPSTSRPWARSSPPRPGARMVKHGNRAASSACGAADVLEALGVVIDLPPPATEQLVAETGVAFLFAPLYHPALPARLGGAPRARRADGVQLPRPADQPGPAHGAGRGRGRPADGPGAGRACWPAAATRRWSSTATTAWTS